MAVPRKKISKSKRNSRRAHDSLTQRQLVACSSCKEMKPPHTVCPACGYYDNKKVISVDA